MFLVLEQNIIQNMVIKFLYRFIVRIVTGFRDLGEVVPLSCSLFHAEEEVFLHCNNRQNEQGVIHMSLK